jgi:hypothetical protein
MSGMRGCRLRGVLGCIAAALPIASAVHVQAAAFTAGDIVVYRVGDGTAGLTSAGTAVFLDEYSSAGVLMQSLPLPTVANGASKRLVASGSAGSEGQLGRSADGQYVVLTGYDAALGTAGVASSSASAVPRTIGRVKFDGSIDTSTALTDFSGGNNPRSATTSDGMEFWGAGGAGGIRYAALGGTTSVQLNTDSVNNRYVGIFGGQLYLSSQKQSIRVAALGTGLPATTGQSAINLPGFATTGSPEAFWFADLDGTPGVDTLYVADAAAGLQKFSLKSGKWFSNGTAGSGNDAYNGVAGTVGGGVVTLYATRKGRELAVLVDASGFDGTLSGSPALLAAADANEAFRGVALAPIAANASSPTATPTATPRPSTAAATATATASAMPSATTAQATPAAATATATSVPASTATPVGTGTAAATLTPAPTASGGGRFMPGDVVVYRVGDGDVPLVNTGSPVFLDEFAPDGTLVQSVALPTTAAGASHQLIASGTAASEGQLTRSSDGRFLIVPGYASDLGGATSLSGSVAAEVPRTVGRVAADGTIDTTTALTDWSDANNARSATSTNGTDLWVGGADGGVRYTAVGSTTSVQLSTDSKNIRAVAIFAGQLYMSTQKGSTIRIGAVGTGAPTTAGQAITNLPGFPLTGLPEAFFLADLDGTPGDDTLYVADDASGLQKFSLVGGTWIANGTIGSGSDAYRGLTGAVTDTTVTLYATRKGDTGGELVRVVDASGHDGAFSDSPVVLAAAAANQAFRGVALAPVDEQSSTPTATSAVFTPTASSTAPSSTATAIAAAPTHTATVASSATSIATGTATPLVSSTPSPTIGVSATPTTVPTNAATPVPTATATTAATATAAPPPICTGDCDGNGRVTISDLVRGVSIALGNAPLAACPAFDCAGTHQVPISCLIRGVNAALQGCPP